jgi:hypothetical protein
MSLCAPLTHPCTDNTCSPTGWHGEGGALPTGGHITVWFYSYDKVFFGTHHVYCTDEAYDCKYVKLYTDINTDIWFKYEGQTGWGIDGAGSSRNSLLI